MCMYDKCYELSVFSMDYFHGVASGCNEKVFLRYRFGLHVIGATGLIFLSRFERIDCGVIDVKYFESVDVGGENIKLSKIVHDNEVGFIALSQQAAIEVVVLAGIAAGYLQ